MNPFRLRPLRFAIFMQVSAMVIGTPLMCLSFYMTGKNISLEIIEMAIVTIFVAALIGNAIGYLAFGRRG